MCQIYPTSTTEIQFGIFFFFNSLWLVLLISLLTCVKHTAVKATSKACHIWPVKTKWALFSFRWFITYIDNEKKSSQRCQFPTVLVLQTKKVSLKQKSQMTAKQLQHTLAKQGLLDCNSAVLQHALCLTGARQKASHLLRTRKVMRTRLLSVSLTDREASEKCPGIASLHALMFQEDPKEDLPDLRQAAV